LPTPSFHVLWTKKVFRKVVDTEGPRQGGSNL
jgi:hypothetical protein